MRVRVQSGAAAGHLGHGLAGVVWTGAPSGPDSGRLRAAEAVSSGGHGASRRAAQQGSGGGTLGALCHRHQALRVRPPPHSEPLRLPGTAGRTDASVLSALYPRPPPPTATTQPPSNAVCLEKGKENTATAALACRGRGAGDEAGDSQAGHTPRHVDSDAAVCHALSHGAHGSPRRGSSQPSGRPAFPLQASAPSPLPVFRQGRGTGTSLSPSPAQTTKPRHSPGRGVGGPRDQSGAVAAANSSTNHETRNDAPGLTGQAGNKYAEMKGRQVDLEEAPSGLECGTLTAHGSELTRLQGASWRQSIGVSI